MDICLRVLKESNQSRFDSYSVRSSVLNISHITFRDYRVHIFSDNLSRNSCIQISVYKSLLGKFILRQRPFVKSNPRHKSRRSVLSLLFEIDCSAIYLALSTIHDKTMPWLV